MKIGCQAVDALGIFMIPVKTELVAHPKQNDHGAGHSHRQTGDVEDGMNPMSTDISNRGFEVVGKHFKGLRVQDTRFFVTDYFYF